MKILVDEMYPATVAETLRSAGIDATAVADLGLAGASDPEVFSAAVTGGYTVLTENVGDFTRIAASSPRIRAQTEEVGTDREICAADRKQVPAR